MKIITIEQEKNIKEKLPQIVNRLFEICKADPNFPLREKLESLESSQEHLNKKITKQEKLLARAKSIREDLYKKIQFYEDSNETLRGKILEDLGSEL